MSQKIETIQQIPQLLNQIYLPTKPNNEELYEYKKVSMCEIYVKLQSYTNKFDNKPLRTLVPTLSIHYKNVRFREAELIEERIGTNLYKYRQLYVLKDKYIGKVKNYIYLLKFYQYNYIFFLKKKKNNINREYCKKNCRC